MGCVSSTRKKRCTHCQEPLSPVGRSYSVHAVHQPQRQGDSYHMVALNSTTFGSSPPVFSDQDKINGRGHGTDDVDAPDKEDMDAFRVQEKSKELPISLIEGKTWSDMIATKIPKLAPKTPIRTPPGEPEMINTWELMEGLEDDPTSPVVPFAHRFRSISFDVSHDHENPLIYRAKTLLPQQNWRGTASPRSNSKANNTISDSDRPMWWEIEDDEEANSKCLEFDPEMISMFRKSLQEVSSDHPFYSKTQGDGAKKVNTHMNTVTNDFVKLNYKKSGCEKVILYFTSLRGVRKTYEDCCHVRVILKSLGVCLDERDMSMHSGFKQELRELLGEGFTGGGLPRVFVGTKHIGGVEEIRRMHEEGRLEEAFDGCEMVSLRGLVAFGAVSCEGCGDIRFVPCQTCSGSCKIYLEGYEDEQEPENENGRELKEIVECGFQRCPDCNENGLIRCPICCY